MNIIEAMKQLKSGNATRIHRKRKQAVSISIDDEKWDNLIRVGLEFGDILAEDWEAIVWESHK